MIGPRNTDAPGHDTGGPSASARFELAMERLAAADEERSRWLEQRIKRDSQTAQWQAAHPKAKDPRARPEKCPRGHTYNGTRVDGGKVYRACLACRRMRERERRARERGNHAA